MGTNYYWYPQGANPCEHCGRADRTEPLHIGKSSAGWCFSLHIVHDEGIHDLPDWEARWSTGHIESEYGERIEPSEMRRIITVRAWPGRVSDAQCYAAGGIPGPNGLIRHRIDDRHPAHGAGTWDLVLGCFS